MMRWFHPWSKTKPAEVAELEQRAEEAKQFVDDAEDIVRQRRREISESAEYFRLRRNRDHLSELFVELYGRGSR